VTDQFDEGVKELLMTILSLGATAFEANYVLDKIKDRPEPIEQKIDAIKKADDIINTPEFDKVSDEVLKSLQQAVEDTPPVHGSAEYIIKRLEDGGLNKTAAIGVVANLKAESDLDPSIKQHGGGPGRGVAQWEKGGRYDNDRINLKGFAKSKGTKWQDLDAQIDFILYEMENHPEYKRVKEEINGASTVKDAVLIFLKKYEKAGTPHTEKRIKYGEELEKAYNAK